MRCVKASSGEGPLLAPTFHPSGATPQPTLPRRRIPAQTWHCDCCRAAMIDVALSVLALVAGGLALELYAAGGKRLDYRDDEEFPLDAEGQKKVEERPSGQPA